MVVYSVIYCIGLAGVVILMVNVLYKILLNFINTFEVVALLGYFGSHFQW